MTLDETFAACWASEVARCERVGEPLPDRAAFLNQTAKYAMQSLILESCDGDQEEIDFVMQRSRWFEAFPQQRKLATELDSTPPTQVDSRA